MQTLPFKITPKVSELKQLRGTGRKTNQGRAVRAAGAIDHSPAYPKEHYQQPFQWGTGKLALQEKMKEKREGGKEGEKDG